MSLVVQPGDRVMVRGVSGAWRPATARSGVRIDHANLLPGQPPYETVSVLFEGADRAVNWPEPDVALLDVEPSPWAWADRKYGPRA